MPCIACECGRKQTVRTTPAKRHLSTPMLKFKTKSAHSLLNQSAKTNLVEARTELENSFPCSVSKIEASFADSRRFIDGISHANVSYCKIRNIRSR